MRKRVSHRSNVGAESDETETLVDQALKRRRIRFDLMTTRRLTVLLARRLERVKASLHLFRVEITRRAEACREVVGPEEQAVDHRQRRDLIRVFDPGTCFNHGDQHGGELREIIIEIVAPAVETPKRRTPATAGRIKAVARDDFDDHQAPYRAPRTPS